VSVLLLCNGKCEIESTPCRRRRALQVCKLLARRLYGLVCSFVDGDYTNSAGQINAMTPRSKYERMESGVNQTNTNGGKLMRFKNAITRLPAQTFSQGLTSSSEGQPSVEKALDQHGRYCDALRACGLKVDILAAAAEYPDSTFVEDTAILAARVAIIMRPGAQSRLGEIELIKNAILTCRTEVMQIIAPGSMDGGDVCQADEHFFIGLSARTNVEGARQLSAILQVHGYTSSTVDIRGQSRLLHLKSGIAYLGNKRLAIASELSALSAFQTYELIEVASAETYAANCIHINDRILIPAGYPKLAAALESLGYTTLALDVSEFRKMDGGLSCLSLRF
jgi:dimethylargininase